jgi:hypothetical protein
MADGRQRPEIGKGLGFEPSARSERFRDPFAHEALHVSRRIESFCWRVRRRDLLDLARLEEAGLLGKAPLPEELRGVLGPLDWSRNKRFSACASAAQFPSSCVAMGKAYGGRCAARCRRLCHLRGREGRQAPADRHAADHGIDGPCATGR